MRRWVLLVAVILLTSSVTAWGAYHHAGERDAARFLEVYPEKKGTKLDHCALCHTGGSVTNKKGKTITLGSCQYCHEITKYGKASSVVWAETLNVYGVDYKSHDRDVAKIDALDSDGDGTINRNFASRTGDDAWEAGVVPLTLAGSVLTEGFGDGAALDDAGAAALAVLACGSLTLP